MKNRHNMAFGVTPEGGGGQQAVVQGTKNRRRYFGRFGVPLAPIVMLLCGVVLLVLGSLPLPAHSGDGEQIQRQIAELLSTIRGVGDVHTVVNLTDEGIGGIAVMCEGADDAVTRHTVITAIATVYDIPTNHIFVTTLQRKEEYHEKATP